MTSHNHSTGYKTLVIISDKGFLHDFITYDPVSSHFMSNFYKASEQFMRHAMFRSLNEFS